jgi:hypothetical protein
MSVVLASSCLGNMLRYGPLVGSTKAREFVGTDHPLSEFRAANRCPDCGTRDAACECFKDCSRGGRRNNIVVVIEDRGVPDDRAWAMLGVGVSKAVRHP